LQRNIDSILEAIITPATLFIPAANAGRRCVTRRIAFLDLNLPNELYLQAAYSRVHVRCRIDRDARTLLSGQRKTYASKRPYAVWILWYIDRKLVVV
jgi:hypothetical protein